MSEASKWTRIGRMSAAFNVLTLVLFAIFIGMVASRKVMEEGTNDVWIDVPVFWPSFLAAILTFLFLKFLSDQQKKVFSAINLGLGIYTLYYLLLVV